MTVAELIQKLEQFDRDADVYICSDHPWLVMRATAVRRMNIQHFYEEGEDFQIVIDVLPDRK